MTFTVVMVLALGMTACGNKTPSEKANSAGQAVNDAAKAIGAAVGDAAKTTGAAVGDALKATDEYLAQETLNGIEKKWQELLAKATGNAVGDAATATGEAVGEALKATDEYLTQSKDTEVKAAQEALNGIEKKWQDLVATAAPATGEEKADLQTVKAQMAKILADAQAKLFEAEDAGIDAWQQNIKPALDAALQKAQKLYDFCHGQESISSETRRPPGLLAAKPEQRKRF
jgi:hypothetical protein